MMNLLALSSRLSESQMIVVFLPHSVYMLCRPRGIGSCRYQLTGIGSCMCDCVDYVAVWIRQPTTDQRIPGSNPGRSFFFSKTYKNL